MFFACHGPERAPRREREECEVFMFIGVCEKMSITHSTRDQKSLAARHDPCVLTSEKSQKSKPATAHCPPV